MQDPGLQFLVMFLVFWFQAKPGLKFLEDIPTGKLQSWCQNMRLGGAHFLMALALKNSLDHKTLISLSIEGERDLPHEICSFQD